MNELAKRIWDFQCELTLKGRDEKMAMRVKNINEEFNTMRDVLCHALEFYPQTRDSDTALYFKCCELLGARTMDEIIVLNLSIVSVHKLRQKIQNIDGLYKPNDQVSFYRDILKQQNIVYFGGE